MVTVVGNGGGEFTVEQQTFLIKHVRALAISHRRDGTNDENTVGPLLKAELEHGLEEAEKLGLRGIHCGGAFVTYKEQPGNKMRGCIGEFFPEDEMFLIIQHRAISALYDDRFVPMSLEELETPGHVNVRISVLSDLELIPDGIRGDALIAMITPGVHGIFVHEKNGKRGGTYLPQVCLQEGWTVPQFLTETAVNKAGIPTKDPLNDMNLMWMRYTATVITENVSC